jgi:iron complex transport system substrate-binding protein
VAVLLLGAGSTPSASFQAGGEAEQPAKAPARVISLVPAVTEMLFAIGAGNRVAAVSSFDRFPPEVATLPRVGALLDPDVERILSLRPDLVIVYGSQKDLITQLARARIPIFRYAHAGLGDVTDTLRDLGRRVGAAERATRLATEIESRIATVRAQAKDRPHPRTLIVFGRDAFALRGIYASGGIGFIHDMVTAAGGENVFADVRQESVQATTELLIARRPAVILELRADPIDRVTEAREIRVWSALASIPAVRDRRVHIIGDARTVIPGPRVAEGVELLFRAIHGG